MGRYTSSQPHTLACCSLQSSMRASSSSIHQRSTRYACSKQVERWSVTASEEIVTGRYGPKLSARHYNMMISALHSEIREELVTTAQDEILERAEFYLLVDLNLGVGFPLRRRRELYAAIQRTRRWQYWYLFLGLFCEDRSGPLVRALLRNCAKVLDRKDLYALFNIPEDFEYER